MAEGLSGNLTRLACSRGATKKEQTATEAEVGLSSVLTCPVELDFFLRLTTPFDVPNEAQLSYAMKCVNWLRK